MKDESKFTATSTSSNVKMDFKTNPQEFLQVVEEEGFPLKQADPWIHRADNMRCKTCMWFVVKERSGPSHPLTPVVGRCRRHAPSMSGYPVVFNNDWCGDHRIDENKI